MNTYCFENLEEIEPHLKAAFEQAQTLSFDLSLPWYSNFVKTALLASEKAKFYVSENGEGQVSILPMCTIQPSTKLRTIRSLDNFYTSFYAPIGQGSNVELLTQAISKFMRESPTWDAVHFRPLDGSSPSSASLKQALRNIGLWPYEYFCFGNWYLPVNGLSYAEYHKTLPSKLKNTIKRKKSHFFANGVGRLEIITDGNRVDVGIAAYQKVYSTSWKIQEPFPDFMPGLIRLCARQGWLRLGIAYLNDEPIATQLWIVSHRRAAIFKLAYNEQFASYSAGTILSAHLMEYALDVDKVEEVDYLIGDDAYKKDWMSHRRERIGIIAYNPRTFLGLFGAAKESLSSLRKKLRLGIAKILGVNTPQA